MKIALHYWAVLVYLSICMVSCNKTKKELPKLNNRDMNGEKSQKELQSYYAFAKNAKTEYQLDSFINKLTLVRVAIVKEIGGEENWLNHLSWLKKYGSKIISETTRGVPNLSVRDKSPYGMAQLPK